MSLRQAYEMDIQTIDPETLVDASLVIVDIDLPKSDRMRSMVDQMGGNPYFFRSNNIVVKVSYADTHITLDERMESYLRTL